MREFAPVCADFPEPGEAWRERGNEVVQQQTAAKLRSASGNKLWSTLCCGNHGQLSKLKFQRMPHTLPLDASAHI